MVCAAPSLWGPLLPHACPALWREPVHFKRLPACQTILNVIGNFLADGCQVEQLFPRKKGGSRWGQRTAVAPSQWPGCHAHQSKYSEAVFRSCPPGPNTWTLNIQPLGQFRPHRGFLLARSTLLTSVARLLHTAGGRVPCPAL